MAEDIRVSSLLLAQCEIPVWPQRLPNHSTLPVWFLLDDVHQIKLALCALKKKTIPVLTAQSLYHSSA